MGLDITAYKGLKPLAGIEPNEHGEVPDYDTQWLPGASMEWSEKAFPGRGKGVDASTVYEWEDRIGFHAGSYGGYGEWRDSLARFAGFPSSHWVFQHDPDGPFTELLNFADNEGVIGPVVAAKLAKDFTDNEAKAVEYASALGSKGDYWLSKYREWQKAFEMAAAGGAVELH